MAERAATTMQAFPVAQPALAPTAPARGGLRVGRRYLACFAGAVCAVLVVVAAGLGALHRQGRLAPVPATGNLCLDEKLEWLKASGDMRCAVLVVGSSMALNNLDGATLAAHLPTGARLLNLAAWGLKAADTRDLLRWALPRTQPRLVVLVTGPMDFYLGPHAPIVRPQAMDAVLGSRCYPLLVAQHLDPIHYWQKRVGLDRLRQRRDDYGSLAFDAWGGIPLEIAFPAVDDERWAERVHPERFDERQYRALAGAAADLRDQGIELVCAQAPLRRAAIAALGADDEAHWQRVQEIIAGAGDRFVDLHRALVLGDECFADYSHLNARGAAAFTTALCARIEDRLSALGAGGRAPAAEDDDNDGPLVARR